MGKYKLEGLFRLVWFGFFKLGQLLYPLQCGQTSSCFSTNEEIAYHNAEARTNRRWY